LREFQLEPVEPAAEQGAAPQLFDQRINAVSMACKRAVDALMGQQHAALQPETGADRAQRFAQAAKIRQGCELIEGGDFERHGGGLAGGRGSGNPPDRDGISLACQPLPCPG